MGFFLNREQFFVPAILLLKAFEDAPDSYIFDRLIKGAENNAYYRGVCVALLRRAQDAKLFTKKDVLQYIGKHFRVRASRTPDWFTDEQVGQFLLDQCVLTHLKTGSDKFNLLAYMIQRVCLLAKGECAPDNPDSLSNQEVTMSGHVYLNILTERLDYWLWSLAQQLQRQLDLQSGAVEMSGEKNSSRKGGLLGALAGGPKLQFNEQLLRSCSKNAFLVCRGLDYFVATGNLPHKSGLVGLQSAGITVTADSINRLRFLSHFAAVHRGAFFTEMRSSGVRQLRPEAWGFICSVHTPDGSPCGLLNHLTKICRIQSQLGNSDAAVRALLRLGVIEWQSTAANTNDEFQFPVFVDGCLVGYLPESRAVSTVSGMRALKCNGIDKMTQGTEICFIPRRKSGLAAPSPGLFVFTNPARFLRPVRNLKLNKVEMVGTLEQTWLPIALLHTSDDSTMEADHAELRADCQLSLLGSFAPHSDFNQSPRNVYQCQMIKQAIGWGFQAPHSRADLKSYSLVCPQVPLCRTMAYTEADGDDHPTGCSAVVAVIAYSGYDMEDAMVVSKASKERGLLRANIYISALVDLRDVDREHEGPVSYFFCKDHRSQDQAHLDDDGLPALGVTIKPGDIVCSYRHIHSQTQFGVQRFKGSDMVIVERVALIPDSTSGNACEWPVRASILLRQPRAPVIGDKCASRHGQKGICSSFWPEGDMPFNEQGMSADIIFNPHGFPSRMTVGMMLESMAGKAAAAHGLGWIDASPFTYPAKGASKKKKRQPEGDMDDEEEEEAEDAVDYLGRLLASAGYEYYGTETMISGVTGEELEAQIFTGIVYYQRLRHMVADKFQCRATGPVDPCTGQPIKGRKRGGGIRLGEMERDALIASGTSFLLTDRLFHCSDKSRAVACRRCGSLVGVSPVSEKTFSNQMGVNSVDTSDERYWMCRMCGKSDATSVISLPFASRFLISELAAMNIRVKLDLSPVTRN